MDDLNLISEMNLPEQPPLPQQLPFVQPARKNRYFQPHDSLFARLSLVLGFLFVRYVAVYADGFLTTGFFLLLYFCSGIYIRKAGCKPKLPHHILGAVICAFSLVFSLTASPLLHGLCFVFLMLALIWRINAVCSGVSFVTRYFPFDLSETVCAEPLRHMDAAPQTLSASVKKSGTASAVKTVLLGLLVTIPLTGIVAGLLASADSGVEMFLKRISSPLTDNTAATIAQCIFGIPAGFWIFGMLYSTVQRRLYVSPMPEDAVYEEKLAAVRIIPNLGLYAGVTPICLLYLVYVISQTGYFLSAFAGKLPGDMIYSEYARRGFFELCAIAVINLFVILVLTGCAKQGGKERPKLLTGYAVMLCVFTLFIIATALAKMVLYIDAYGLTRLRLYTAWFMVLLAAAFLVLLVRQFTNRIPTAKILTASFILLFGILCFSRPDARIAEYNIMRYEQGTLADLDARMLCTLSEDAYVVMLRHLDTLEKAGCRDYVYDKAYALTKSYDDNPDRGWNLSAQLLIQFRHEAARR